jgi:hypothetical protein
MYLENRSVTDTVNVLAAASCVELFADYGVTLERRRFDWGQSNAPLLSGVMGFMGGPMRGTCLLACEQAPLTASCPPGGKPRDWIGELSNQLIGRLKVKLLAYDIDVALTTPIVLQGIRLHPLPKASLDPVMFFGGSGLILEWIEVEVEGGYSLPATRPPAAGETGELLLF